MNTQPTSRRHTGRRHPNPQPIPELAAEFVDAFQALEANGIPFEVVHEGPGERCACGNLPEQLAA